MRLNKFLALATGMSRRQADAAIEQGRVTINNQPAIIAAQVKLNDRVMLGDQAVKPPKITTILLNKSVGYVCSRLGQGNRTIYDLLPADLHHLKPVGRLDKDSSGLLLLTNDGDLANQLMHPRYQKSKIYELEIEKPLSEKDFKLITKLGVDIGDKTLSRFQLRPSSGKPKHSAYRWQAVLAEGRNRQIRRTFTALGYKVTKLHRTHFGPYKLNDLSSGRWRNQN